MAAKPKKKSPDAAKGPILDVANCDIKRWAWWQA